MSIKEVCEFSRVEHKCISISHAVPASSAAAVTSSRSIRFVEAFISDIFCQTPCRNIQKAVVRGPDGCIMW